MGETILLIPPQGGYICVKINNLKTSNHFYLTWKSQSHSMNSSYTNKPSFLKRRAISPVCCTIGIAAKKVNREVNKAGLVDILGRSGCENVQGEEQQKLDVYANVKPSWRSFRQAASAAGIASEENEDVTTFHEGLCHNAKYIVCMDPLDGSSNIDVNVSVGTIFSIYRRKSPIGEAAKYRRLPAKRLEMVAAGIHHLRLLHNARLHGRPRCERASRSTRRSANSASHPNIKTPASGKIYSINEGNYEKSPVGIKKYIKYCQRRMLKPTGPTLPLHRLAGSGFPPQHAQGRRLHVPLDRQSSQRKTAPPG